MENITWALKPPGGAWAGVAAPGRWAPGFSQGPAAGLRWRLPIGGAVSATGSRDSVRLVLESALSFASSCERGRSARAQRWAAAWFAARRKKSPTYAAGWAAGVGSELACAWVEREAAAAQRQQHWGASVQPRRWLGSLLHSASNGVASLERRLSKRTAYGGAGAQEQVQRHGSMRVHASYLRRFALSEQGACARQGD